jgi:SAM-dependent methyltransferase
MSQEDPSRTDAIDTLRSATRRHYDRWAFEYDTEDRRARLMERGLLGMFVGTYARGRVADVGCGVGAVMKWTSDVADVKPIGFDLSWASLRQASQKNGRHRLCCADNLSLPVRPGAFDTIISNGVIHHTPDARRALAELTRALRPGGWLYLSVYSQESFYFRLFSMFAPLRTYRRRGGGDAPLKWLFLPWFYVYLTAGMLIYDRRIRWVPSEKVWRIFNDQFMTPRASFHTRGEILQWAESEHLTLAAERRESAGTMWSFVLQKT